MIDATGKIADNPEGLATELEWRAFHDEHVTGHTRWLGWKPATKPDAQAAGKWLIIAVDAPAADLRLKDSNGQVLSEVQLHE